VELGQGEMVLNVLVDVRAPVPSSTSTAPSTATAAQAASSPASNAPGVQPIAQPIGFRCPAQQTVQTFSDAGLHHVAGDSARSAGYLHRPKPRWKPD
jgi:hypothetical protein